MLPLLKQQGYRICINTNEVGKDILVSNPYVDEIIVQRANQIYPDKLDDYWKHFDNLFDKIIQFSESVEGTLLIVGDRTVQLEQGPVLVQGDKRFSWDKDAIHAECNINYMERMHDIAEVDYEFDTSFYPTKKEFSSENFHNNYLLKGYKLDNRHLKDEYVNKIMELFEKNFCITT